MRGIACLLLLGACAPSAPPGEAWLRVANGHDVEILDPQLATRSADLRVHGALHAGLTRLDPATLRALPDLAAEVSSEGLGRTWRFRLREGLRWSDGSPLEAADLLASWERLRDPATGSPYGGWLRDAEWTLDGLALEVRFPRPMPMFDRLCAFPALAPLPRALREAQPGTAPRPLVGSGPYRLLERRVRDRIRVARNPHSHRAAEVALDGIDFLTVDSLFTALNLYLAGDAELLFDVPPLAVEALRTGRPAEFAPEPMFAALFLRVNVTRPPFDDRAVRRAFAAAVDREALAAAVGGGRDPARSFVPPLVEGYPFAPRRLHDPEAARAALESVRAADAARPERPPRADGPFELLYASTERNRDFAEVLQRQWRETLGVDVRLANQEGRTFAASQRALEYRMSISSWIGDYLDPLTFLEIFRSDHPSNRTGWDDAEYDALLDRAAEARDAAERMVLLAQAEERLLAEAVVIPLLADRGMELVAPRVLGFERNPRNVVDWAALRLRGAEGAR